MEEAIKAFNTCLRVTSCLLTFNIYANHDVFKTLKYAFRFAEFHSCNKDNYIFQYVK